MYLKQKLRKANMQTKSMKTGGSLKVFVIIFVGEIMVYIFVGPKKTLKISLVLTFGKQEQQWNVKIYLNV